MKKGFPALLLCVALLVGLGYWLGHESAEKPKKDSSAGSRGDFTDNLIENPFFWLPSKQPDATESVPDSPGKVLEHYTIDGYNYDMEVGETLTLFHSRTPISPYYAYTWFVLDGEELVDVERGQGTCQFYAKQAGVVTIQANLDETVVNYGSSSSYSYEYTMTITISPATGAGSPGGIMHYQVCSTCDGSGKIQVGSREMTCPTCNGQKYILR